VKAYWGVEVYLHAFFDLGTRWRWEFSFTPRPLYPHRKSSWCPLDRRLVLNRKHVNVFYVQQIKPDNQQLSLQFYVYTFQKPVWLGLSFVNPCVIAVIFLQILNNAPILNSWYLKNSTSYKWNTRHIVCSSDQRPKFLCNFTQNSPSWEANSHSASQEITCLLQNWKVHCHVHRSLHRFFCN
jgi:hypothetical protein